MLYFTNEFTFKMNQNKIFSLESSHIMNKNQFILYTLLKIIMHLTYRKQCLAVDICICFHDIES